MMCNSFQINVLRACKTNYNQLYTETIAYQISIKITNLKNIMKLQTLIKKQNAQSMEFLLKRAEFKGS